MNLVTPKLIERIDSPSGRKYKTPEGFLYPSITTVLSQTADKSYLEEWKQKVGEDEAERITKKASSRGTNLHKVCEDYLFEKELTFPTVQSKRHFRQIEKYVKRISDVKGIELPLYSNILKIAGTTDCIGFFDDELSVIDFKTSRKQKKEEWIDDYFLQSAFYSIAFAELYGMFPKKIVIIMATDDENPCIFVKDVQQYKFKLIKRIRQYHEQHS